jgi:hypothetical protein
VTDPVVRFYSGAARDHRGRTLEEIQGWSDERLEGVHDFIQWLFPLPEPSPVNPYSPLLTAETIDAFRESPELRERMRMSLDRMLRFYGFEPGGTVVRAGDFSEQAANWVHLGNHNHLRITRILRCCSLAGLEWEARAFLRALEDVYAEESRKARPGISAESLRYWRQAVR